MVAAGRKARTTILDVAQVQHPSPHSRRYLPAKIRPGALRRGGSRPSLTDAPQAPEQQKRPSRGGAFQWSRLSESN